MNEKRWRPFEEFETVEADEVVVSRLASQHVRVTSGRNDLVLRLPDDVQLFVLADLSNDQREALAAYAHEAWSGWMRYMFNKAEVNEDGTWTMPADLVTRWKRQMTTPYAELPESEKASDRAEADKIFGIMRASG